MHQLDAERTQKNKTQTHLFYFCVIMLLGTGFVTLYSASYAFAQRLFNDGNFLIIRQSFFGAAGVAAFFVLSRISLDFVRKMILPMIIFTAVLCLLTRAPGIGVELNNASRWIEIGEFTYQPSEMVKFVLPLYLAHILDKKADNLGELYSGVLPPVIVTGIFFFLIYIQNNFSTAVFVVFNAMIIFFLAGIKYRYFFAAVAMIIPVSALLVFTMEHRVRRLVSFLRPQWEPLGAGFQVSSSKDAIISGGLWGKGLGEGTRKLGSVPEIQADFIFSAYAEETGFIGILVFFALFVLFAFLGYRTALKSETVFGRLLAAGLTTIVVTQAFLNTAVVCGALPVTGIPLPFFSAGGSSLLTSLICSGLIANVARKNGSNAGGFAYDKNGYVNNYSEERYEQ